MPVFNCNNMPHPFESEVNIVKIIHLSAHDVFTINDHKKKEKIFIVKGKVLLKSDNGIRDFNKNDVIVTVTIGVQKPDQVDIEAVKRILPVGTVSVSAVLGGLDVPDDEREDLTVIASAAIDVRLDLP